MKRKQLLLLTLSSLLGLFLLTGCGSESANAVDAQKNNQDVSLESDASLENDTTHETNESLETNESHETDTSHESNASLEKDATAANADDLDNPLTASNTLTESLRSGDNVWGNTDWTPVVDTKLTHDTYIEGFLNERFGVTVGYSGRIFYTENAASEWQKAENSSMCRFCLDIVNESLIWCGGNGGHVRVSKDGGKTWDKVSDVSLGTAHTNIDFLDDTTGWIANAERLSMTTDGGQTWNPLTLPEAMAPIATIALQSPTKGYLLTIEGQLFVTADAGESWELSDIALSSYGITDTAKQPKLTKQDVAIADMSFTDENNGLIVFSGIKTGEGRKVFCTRTSDGGKNWLGEELPLLKEFSPTKVFLTSDGKYLTLGSKDKKLVVYRYQ